MNDKFLKYLGFLFLFRTLANPIYLVAILVVIAGFYGNLTNQKPKKVDYYWQYPAGCQDYIQCYKLRKKVRWEH